jgi:chorismate mutase/prephenate dehydratase
MVKKDRGDEIERLRRKIDVVDANVLKLLNERARFAAAIGEEKRRLGGTNFYDPEREAAIFQRLQHLTAKATTDARFPSSSIPFVFREIVSACRSLEASLRVGYLGPAGTYSQIAANQAFGHSVEYHDCSTIDGVFDSVFRRQTDYGVVPVENSAEGGVIQTMDSLLRFDLKIRGEWILRIDHYLVSKATNVSEVQRVYSHPAAIAQCRAWLAKNLPGIQTVPCPSTAAAGKLTLQDPTSAAIGSRLSAEVMGLNILRERIQDQSDNATRFIIIAHEDGPITGFDRTSLVLAPEDGKSVLFKIVSIFESDGLELSRFESRASPDRSWTYFYFVDLLGHRAEKRMERALQALRKRCSWVKILGSYPRTREAFAETT